MSKVIVLTGVSSGFGQRMAIRLAERGHVVYGTVRKPCEMHPSVHLLTMDLMDPSSIQAAVETVVAEQGRIDVLINNAGMHLGGPIEEAPADLFSRQMATNVNGLVHMLQTVLPVMREQGGGTVINFSSLGGLMGLPFQGFYSASKFAIEGLSEALRMEVRAFNIKVIVINPGDFHTSNTANRTNVVKPGGPYEAQFERSKASYEQDENGGWDPDILARKLVKVVESRHPCNRYIIASFTQKFGLLLKRLLPISLFSRILGSFYKIP